MGSVQVGRLSDGAPFHDGAIKLLKEKNVWTPEHQKWQDGIVKRQGLLRQGWADMIAKEPAAKGADAAKLSSCGPRAAPRS